jgi:hypothetical protein
MKEYSRRNQLPRYFLHGILLCGIGLALQHIWIMWVFLFIFTEVFGPLVWILVLVSLFFIMGGLNSFLAFVIWSVEMKIDLKNLLGQGSVLAIMLLIAHLPTVVAHYFVPGLATTITIPLLILINPLWFSVSPDLATMMVLFIIYSFIDGFIARKMADLWEE